MPALVKTPAHARQLMFDAFDTAREDWFDALASNVADDTPGDAVRCAACGAHLTRARHARAVAGCVHHVATNPADITFHFVTFAVAPGCMARGQPTATHSWFPPARWQCAHCASCGTFCGWRFTDVDGGEFHALIEDCLVEDDGS
ncbi:MAG: cereblon family protein [Gammaproteobacteria bacterium]